MSQVTEHSRIFTLIDPRTFDGNPYEVGEGAVRQLRAVIGVAESAIPLARLMVRNAELERQMSFGDDPDPDAWQNGPQARILDELRASLAAWETRLKVLEKAAGFDPKHPGSPSR